MDTKQKEYYMRLALDEAVVAASKKEVPIGAIIVLNGEVIGRGHNLRETSQDATSHAEMNAIRDANQKQGSWRLEDAEMFVTVEPCPMCSGALIWSRMKKVTFGTADAKGGTAGTFMNLLSDTRFNHQVEVESGILEAECQQIISGFFRQLREEKKQNKLLNG